MFYTNIQIISHSPGCSVVQAESTSSTAANKAVQAVKQWINRGAQETQYVGHAAKSARRHVSR